MEINILVIITGIILIFCAGQGIAKGLFKSVFSMVAVFLAIVITTQVHPYVVKYLKENTKVYESICENVQNTIQSPDDKEIKKKSDQKKMIDDIELPELFKTNILENNYEDAYKILNVTSFYDYISSYIANVILNGIAYLGTYFLIWILLMVISFLFNGVSKIPIIRSINRIGGFLFGIGKGLLLIWLLFLIVTVFTNFEFFHELYNCIEENKILKFLYENNILQKYFENLQESFFGI